MSYNGGSNFYGVLGPSPILDTANAVVSDPVADAEIIGGGVLIATGNPALGAGLAAGGVGSLAGDVSKEEGQRSAQEAKARAQAAAAADPWAWTVLGSTAATPLAQAAQVVQRTLVPATHTAPPVPNTSQSVAQILTKRVTRIAQGVTSPNTLLGNALNVALRGGVKTS